MPPFFWRYALDDAVRLTGDLFWRPTSPVVLSVVVAATGLAVVLSRAGAFG